MLKSFIGADMRLYERFGVGLHNNPDTQKRELRKASIYKAFKDLIKQFATILQQNRD